MDDDPVLLEVIGGVAVVTLNRPEAHNPLDEEVDGLFFRYLDLLRTDRDVRVVVWRGNGPSFSAGRPPGWPGGPAGEGRGDGSAGGNGGAGANGGNGTRGAPRDLDALERAHWPIRLLHELPVPIVCALKGWSLGTAFERALLCDIRVAGEGATLGLTAADHGLLPDSGGVARLYEIGGAALALDLALTGRRIDAREALRLGLVSQVVPDEALDDAVVDLAARIAAQPPLAVRLVREHVQALAAAGVRTTLGRELVGQAMVLASHDIDEHRRARLEDRPPRYARR
ncbi:MAG TPA: enoyl-CoA hydratase/isomerase family protein [Acidimicrobiales bacterium]